MQGISESWRLTIDIIIAAFPVVGGLLFIREEAKKREFNRCEITGLILTMWGFFGYVSWQFLQIPFGTPTPIGWWEGFLIPLMMALTISAGFIKIVIRERQLKKQNPIRPKE